MAWLSEGSVLMEPATIACDGRDPAGRRCGAEALIRRIDYRYTTEVDILQGEARQVLHETHYEVDCPVCGLRTQVEHPVRASQW
ncbi:MAG: hypothetical protein DCC67_13705 [Planctomycetota bacterium]|nr:MAG: hypothetical protein DCC67_13705 [Planctomycetota bacterium]